MAITDAFRQKLANYGVWTYRSAWGLEILAAGIGLTTGIVLGLQAFNSNESADATDLILASAPFFMVALAELTKIPIATLLFSAGWIWKPVLAFFLFLLAAITFETVFMGLERATTLRQLEYQEIVKEGYNLRTELSQIASDIVATESDQSVAKAQANVDEVANLAEDERLTISQQLAAAEKELEGQVVLSPEAAVLRDQLNDIEETRKTRIAEQKTDEAEAYARFIGQRDSYVERLRNENATEDQKRAWTNELSRLVNPVPALKAKFEVQLSELDQRISETRAKYEVARSKMTEGTQLQRGLAESRRADLLLVLSNSDKKWAVEKDKARQALSDAQTSISERTKLLVEVRERQRVKRKQLEELEKKRISLARRDQVQRIASRVYGTNPEDVGPDKANLIALIWFGSLAGLAALAGPVTAMVALGLQRIGLATTGSMVQSPISRLLRRLLLSWRWKRTRTVKVEVEKPVEKIVEVERRVEVPIEKIVKEILYVPLLTDDPEAVRKSLYESVPPEVADVVKVTLSGRGRGSQA